MADGASESVIAGMVRHAVTHVATLLVEKRLRTDALTSGKRNDQQETRRLRSKAPNARGEVHE